MILPLSLFHFYDIANKTLQQGSVAGKRVGFANSPEIVKIKAASRWFPFRAEKRENEYIWAQFRAVGIRVLGEAKFQSILTKYATQVAPLKKGDPLLPEHIQYVYVNTFLATTTELKEGTTEKIRDLLNTELSERVHFLSIPFTGFSYLAKIPLRSERVLGVNYFKHEYHKALPLALQHVQSIKPLRNEELAQIQTGKAFCGSKFAVWLEECCRKTVNWELDRKMLIPAPYLSGSTEGFYKVYRKITAKGLLAYALRPATHDSELPPLIVFRGTQWNLGAEDALHSLYEDTYTDIGKQGWNAAQKQFQKLMQDPKFLQLGQQVTVAGYSLGGVHAQRFVAQHAAQVARLVTFNAPGINRVIAQQFAKSTQPHPLQIHVIRTKGDFCHSVGECHLGLGVLPSSRVDVQLLEFSYSGEKQILGKHRGQIFRHVELPRTIKEVVTAEALKTELDAKERGPEVSKHNKIHQRWGVMIRGLLQFLSGFFYLVEKILRITILRTS